MKEFITIQKETDSKKKDYKKPLMMIERFEPQNYCAICQYRATLHCGIYGNRNYYNSHSHLYIGPDNLAHGADCQNTVVTYRKNTDGSFTITGQEMPKGSIVTYLYEPTIRWGTRGVGAPGNPSSNNEGAINSYALWSSKDVNGTGDYVHEGYVASWTAYPDGTSNVS